MPHNCALKTDQRLIISTNYKAIIVWIWIAYKVTENNCCSQLFIQTQNWYPSSFDKRSILTWRLFVLLSYNFSCELNSFRTYSLQNISYLSLQLSQNKNMLTFQQILKKLDSKLFRLSNIVGVPYILMFPRTLIWATEMFQTVIMFTIYYSSFTYNYVLRMKSWKSFKVKKNLCIFSYRSKLQQCTFANNLFIIGLKYITKKVIIFKT